MKTPISILIIEDSEDDKELLLRELTRGGYNPEYECVETREALDKALEKQSWDIILSDYSMPKFDGLSALKMVKARGLDIPFILISGTIGEDIAVAAMKSGAHDYFMKGKLACLIPAIERELKETEVRRQCKLAGENLIQSQRDLQEYFENDISADYVVSVEGEIINCNRTFLDMFGFKEKLPSEKFNINQLYKNPDDRKELIRRVKQKGRVKNYLLDFVDKDGKTIHSILNSIGKFDESGELVSSRGYIVDITENKKTENDLIIRSKLNLLKAKVWEAVSDKTTNEADLINLMLKEAGNVLDISRASFVLLNEKKKSFVTEHQWFRPEAGAARKVEIPAKYVDYYLGQDSVQIPLQLNKTTRFFATPILKLYHIKSWLAVTYGNKQNPSGLFTFTDCNTERVWSDLEIEVLIDLSKIFESFSIKRKAEESLLKLSHAVEQSPVSIVITDTKGTIEYGNPKITEITGYQINELIGKNSRIFNSGEKPKSEYKILWDTISSGKEWFGEFHNIKKNGELYWENASISPILNEKGKITHYVAVKEDITERKQTEQEITMLAHALKSINECVSITDLDDNIVYINESFLKTYGYSENELVGEHISIVQSSNNPPNVVGKILPDTLLGGWKGELINKRKDGSEFSVSLSTTVIKGKDGNPLGLIGVASDITERKVAEHKLINALEKAQESDRLKSAFLANLSHEIRTPMNGILGFAELLKEPDLATGQQNEYLEIIESSGARMLNIINDIIDISKIESGQMNVSVSQTNAIEQLDFVYKFFKPEVEQKGLTLLMKNSLSLAEASIVTDREKLYAIMTNLVKNAIKYTHDGFIEFGSSATSSPTGRPELNFYVKDTGIGIPIDRQEAIFERFIQADISRKDAYQGAGLGLAISKAYVEMLGGSIWLESEVGKGSTFYFTIPLNNAHEQNINVKSADPLDEQPGKNLNLKVLIIEDDESSAKLLSIMCQGFSEGIGIAINGIAAVEICRQSPDIDLILMDIQMPEMDGYEATRQIRMFNSNVVIIAQTAFAMSGDKEKAIEVGCNDYITKPIKREQLLELIQKYFK